MFEMVIVKLKKALLLMSENNHFINFRKFFNKNNIFVISFFIFISIPIIIGVTLGAKKLWFDVLSIVAVFYISIPILIIIFTMNEKGLVRKTLDLFKFKEMKEVKNKHLSAIEKEKIKAFELEKEKEKKPKSRSDIVFILIILIIYGILLLISALPSLILFSIK